MISVLTPCFNSGAFIADALASVGAQSAPIEHVVVDGGSTDNTVDILKGSAWPGLRWVSEPDGGQSEALNKALEMSSGEIIGWLNADEWYLPGVADHVRRAFLDPSVDVVFGEYYRVDMFRRFVRSVPSHRFSNFVLRRYGCFVPSCATFIRRSSLPDEPWDVDLRWIMDWDLWLRLAEDGAKFRHLRTTFAAFTLHSEQVTAGDPSGRSHEWTDVKRRHGIPQNAAQGKRRYIGRGVHAGLKLVDGGYFRQLADGRRLRGQEIAVPNP